MKKVFSDPKLGLPGWALPCKIGRTMRTTSLRGAGARLAALVACALLATACTTIRPPSCSVRTSWGTAYASTPAAAERLAAHLEAVAPGIVARVPGLTRLPVDVRFVESMHNIPAFARGPGSFRVNGITLADPYRRWIEEPERANPVEERRVLAHELVHDWIGPDWSTLPHFLEEGLAENMKDAVVPEGYAAENLDRVLVLANALRGGFVADADGKALGFGVEALKAHPDAELTLILFEKNEIPTVVSTLSIGKGVPASARTPTAYGTMIAYGYLLVSRIGPERLHALCLRAKEKGHTSIPPAWILEAAGLPQDEHDEAWDKAVLELYGPLERKLYTRRSHATAAARPR